MSFDTDTKNYQPRTGRYKSATPPGGCALAPRARRAVRRSRLKGVAFVAALTAVAGAPVDARADSTAYLVNVTVRPGYNFASADQALGYGYGICDRIAEGRSYSQVIRDVKTDFATEDEYQASYLITQAANELCPAQIWQLRNSADSYRSVP